MTPKVSVVVPAYRAGKFLPALCDSLLAQTCGDFEALIWNDGSDDDTLERLAPYRRDARFQVFSWTPNRGVTPTTIELLNRMRGEFWCHPGADDLLAPRFLEARLALAQRYPSATLIHGAGGCIDEDGCPFDAGPQLANMPSSLSGERLLQVLLEHNIINTPSIFVRSPATRRVLPSFRGDWRYAQDWFLWILHAGLDTTMLWDPEPLHFYRVHRGSLSLRPDRATVREAEVRLVPLCALHAAAAFSPMANRVWLRWRHSLYALWLRRAGKLCRGRVLEGEWLNRAATAFYGKPSRVSLASELLRQAWPLLAAARAESRVRKRTPFPVAGLAEIDDPLFHEVVAR
jgi:glycosyltransferase involved in cell wall biosynthesis